jgi:hypothetical protein
VTGPGRLSPSRLAWLWTLAIAATQAAVFWLVLSVAGSPSFISFWNRSFGERVTLTLLFVIAAGRILIWYVRRLHGYSEIRHRTGIRQVPVAFGLAVFGTMLAWLLAIALSVPIVKLYQILLRTDTLEWTVILLPLAYFAQFLFSQSTVIWFLAAGVLWPVAALHPRLRGVLLGYYADLGGRPYQTLGFIKVWNIFGYLIFLLSLLFQSD